MRAAGIVAVEPVMGAAVTRGQLVSAAGTYSISLASAPATHTPSVREAHPRHTSEARPRAGVLSRCRGVEIAALRSSCPNPTGPWGLGPRPILLGNYPLTDGDRQRATLT